MEQNDLESKNITIAGIEDKGWGISLIDEHGLKYNVSKFLKGTQNETKAFQVLKTLPGYGMGMKKCVKFATVPNQQGGQSRYVRIIGEVEENTGNATNTHYPPKNTATGQTSGKTGFVAGRQTNQDDSIRQNVVLKMVSEILAAGVVPITEWEMWANTFYNYKPVNRFNNSIEQKLQEAGLTPEEEQSIDINSF